MSKNETIRQFSERKIRVRQSMKSKDINWAAATLVARKLFGVFSHFQFINVIPQLFIQQFVLKMDSACNSQRKTYVQEHYHVNCVVLIVPFSKSPLKAGFTVRIVFMFK